MLLEHGLKVASMDITDQPQPANDTFLPIKASVTSEDECDRTLQQVIDRWGRIDILVNNAGVMDDMSRLGFMLLTRDHAANYGRRGSN